jgi:hypothetical protein
MPPQGRSGRRSSSESAGGRDSAADEPDRCVLKLLFPEPETARDAALIAVTAQRPGRAFQK